MPQSVRQRNLFAAEDFTVVYDSFRQANFKAYDYDTIRESMVEYIQESHPEIFNDWIQSSEFVALIELIAYLGHNLAFRADLASRENFLATAERRESVLRLAEFLGYQPSRNLPARGLLKIDSVRTSQAVYGVDGSNLKNQTVQFFDENNLDARENFITIMNEIFSNTNSFGRPAANAVIRGVQTELYPTEIASDQDVVFSFAAQVNGSTESFEIHGSDLDQTRQTYYESTPSPNAPFRVLYRNDQQGPTSSDTGFFVGFKQGTLRFSDFNIESQSSNLTLDINPTNINNNDVWVQSVDSVGNITDSWTRVGQEYGTNVIFNAISRDNRKLYAVKTRNNNAISVNFGDGIFSEIPQNLLRVWYRNSLNESYIVEPDDVGTVEFSFDYIGHDNKRYRAKFTAHLPDTVTNASAQESTDSIRQNASRVHATQDRMVSAADYAVLPLTASSNVLKIKSINRTFSGHSRFIDVNDPTGNYQNVNMFSDDGYLYTKDKIKRDVYNGTPSLGAQQFFDTFLASKPKDRELINFYYHHYDEVTPFSNISNSLLWNRVSENQGPGDSGYLTTPSADIVRIGPSGSLINLEVGSLIEFMEEPYSDGTVVSIDVVDGGSNYTSPPTVLIVGDGANATAEASVDVGTGRVTSIQVTNGGAGYTSFTGVIITGGSGSGAIAKANAVNSEKQWTRVTGYYNDGLGIDDSGGNPTGIDPQGLGAIKLADRIPQNAKISRIFPAYSSVIDDATINDATDEIFLQNNFGLRYNESDHKWVLITANNLAPVGPADDFSLANAGSQSGTNNDKSWLIRADYNNGKWTIRTRNFVVAFGSKENVRFYNHNNESKFNTETLKPGRDKIILLAINETPASPRPIGYESSLFVHRYSSTPDGYTDNTKVAVTIADDSNDLYPSNPMIFKDYIGNETVSIDTQKIDGIYQEVLSENGDGDAVSGRDGIKFQWKRLADSNQRIDPAITSIIDVFVLTDFYDRDYRDWLASNRRAERPIAPTSDSLGQYFDSLIDKKSMSDTVRYRPVKYKPLFGPAADEDLQASFKIVKVPGTSISDNEIKSMVVDTIYDFFGIENWDFGEAFYFTELATYIHNQNLGTLASVAIVPRKDNGVFGDLFQIEANTDELFIPDVTTSQINIVDRLSGNVLRSR